MVDCQRYWHIGPLLAVVMVMPGACTGPAKEPFSPPTCQQVPADAVRQTTDQLAAAPEEAQRTGPDGAESGVLPLVQGKLIAYHCRWGSTDSDKHPLALEVLVDKEAPDAIAMLTEGMSGHTGLTLTVPVPGKGRAWNDKDVGVATWVCPVTDDRYATPYLRLWISFPKHPSDPATDAKALAEAIIPLIGCTAGSTDPTSSGSSTTGAAATAASNGTATP